MFIEIIEAMGLEFRETDSESNYWFDFNGIAILVMCSRAIDLKECAKIADDGYASSNFGNGITGCQLLKHFGVEQ